MTTIPTLGTAQLDLQPMLASTSAIPHVTTPAGARAAAQEFEAVFISQMLEHMVAGLPTDGLFGGGSAERVYRSLLVNEYGRNIARAGGFGIADRLMADILRMQEGNGHGQH